MKRHDPERWTLTRRRLAAFAAGLGAARSLGVLAAAPASPEPDLTLAEKAAALFITPVGGTVLTAEETAWLEQWRPSGVILVGANIGTPDETRALIAAIHATNPARPPLVAVDQEGGPVIRLAGDPAPGAAVMGTLPDDEVERLSAARVAFLQNYGIDVNFAPVADIAWTPDSAIAGRAFGSDPATVAAKVAAFERGAAGSVVATTAKHFPGHGRALVDSHEALPTIDLTTDEWLQTDGLPFQAAVRAGVPLVMMGHLRYNQWDDLPASLSPVATRMLRETLGFAGGIVTDDLGMGALSAYDPYDVVDLALMAGIDQVLYVTPAVPVENLIQHVVQAVEAGRLPESRLDASIARIAKATGRQP